MSAVTPSAEQKAPLRGEEGFTIVELMMVVGMVGMLSAMAGPAYQQYADRARVKTLEVLLVQGNQYVKTLYLNNNRYPNAGGYMTPQPGTPGYTGPCSGKTDYEVRDLCEFLPLLPAGTPLSYEACRTAGYKPAFYYISYDGLSYKLEIHCAGDGRALYASQYRDPRRNTTVTTSSFWASSVPVAWAISLSSDATAASTL